MRFGAKVFAAITLTAGIAHAFVPLGPQGPSKTKLQVAPPLIIGPMLKKMKEEKAKENVPLAQGDEVSTEAPGLKVGKETWKWPSAWPYDTAFFISVAEAKAKEAKEPAMDKVNDMASMMSGVAQATAPKHAATEEEEEAQPLFDALEYWSTSTQVTELDSEAAEKLREHYAFYLEDDISVLELGAAEDSYLPTDLKLSRHVGVSAEEKAMKANPSITETMVVDLNKVVDGRDVDDDQFRQLAEEPFDVVIMANTVPYLTKPREVFRSAWYLLKPGGKMIVSFASKESTKDQFQDAQTRMWQEYNDDQHMWMTGSFFHFSAGDGWGNLLGFDISPESAKKADTGKNTFERLTDLKGKTNNYFVIQATKGFQDEKLDVANAERSIDSLCWMLPTLEDRDKKLVVPRLARAVEIASSSDVVDAVERNIRFLPKVYEALSLMDQFAFTIAMQAQMAADLVSNPNFTGSDDEIVALKQGLGLRTPSPEFWVPIGQNTANMDMEDRINLLAYIVPYFGTGDKDQEEALQAFVTGLKPTYDVIRKKCPGMSNGDVELLGTELLAAEVLTPGTSTRSEYAGWLSTLSQSDLEGMLASRKSIREKSKEEMEAYQEQRAEQQRKVEEYRAKMNQQIETARLTRGVVFNPRTQKMELFDNPNKDKKK